jgi:hypothetical protein
VPATSPDSPESKRLRHWLRGVLGPYPAYVRLLRWRHPGVNGLTGPDTEVVIESYPRSGNTFSVTAFELAQNREVRRGDHLHAPAQVILAARMRIPCLVLIRRPRDAIFSHFNRFPDISVRQCLTDYVRFYRTVQPYRGAYLLATFEAVTRDFGSVIRALNAKFGTDFLEFRHTPENEARCFQLIQSGYERRFGNGEPISEAIHSRPSRAKAELKSRAQELFARQYDLPRHAALRERADAVYAEMYATADCKD